MSEQKYDYKGTLLYVYEVLDQHNPRTNQDSCGKPGNVLRKTRDPQIPDTTLTQPPLPRLFVSS